MIFSERIRERRVILKFLSRIQGNLNFFSEIGSNLKVSVRDRG